MTTNKEFMHMNENIGKQLIITDEMNTYYDHEGYENQPLTIFGVDNDGYYLCEDGYTVSEGECLILEYQKESPMENVQWIKGLGMCKVVVENKVNQDGVNEPYNLYYPIEKE